MRKWKPGCHSKKMQLLKIKTDNEAGITLVELLAALSILSVVIILAGSIHMFGQRQFISQTESASQANDFSYAMTVMTTELRKQNPGNVEVEDGIIKINDKVAFYQDGDALIDRETIIAESVDNFNPVIIDDGTGVEVSIESTNPMAANKHYQTTIYFRGESDE